MKSLISNIFTMAAVVSITTATAAETLHYTPMGESVWTKNGTAKFNRALYGAHTGFRIDCSDFPEFGIYLPNMGGNMKIYLPEGDCTAIYTPGRMDYEQGGVNLEVLAGKNEDIAIWKLTNKSTENKDVKFRYGGATGKRFSREGDLGVDKPDCFDFREENCKGNIYSQQNPGEYKVDFTGKTHYTIHVITGDATCKVTSLPSLEGDMKLDPGETKYLALVPGKQSPKYSQLPNLAEQAEFDRRMLTSNIRFDGPDAWLKPVGGALAIAADAIWSGEAWLHGSIGWRTPHLGWRGAYAGDAIGRHDRARTHFFTYAKNQIDSILQIYSHPQQDPSQNLARAKKEWGTPMYSNGYICRRPGHKNEMSHYDMNLVYIDAMMRHFRHTGDTAAMRRLFPIIKRHLDWEKRNYDSDNDGLYDAYCCIWASDALYYNGGKVTHSSAYNAFANKMAAMVASRIGEDPTPYENEARKITNAIDSALWLKDKGHWAEFQDVMGYGRLHEKPAVWTVYHAIDSEIADNLSAYAATVYIDREIPHIPVISIDGDTLYTISTTNWKPYSWSINNVAIAEVMHTALAYWQAGRADEAYALMKAVAYDNMLMGASPLNFGQISRLDAARGECYRDFADPIGVWSRALTEGLYGIRPDLLDKDPHIDLVPGFPRDWNEASVELPDFSYTFNRDGNTARYEIENRYPGKPKILLTVNGKNVANVKVNGVPASWKNMEQSMEYPRIIIDVPSEAKSSVVIEYGDSLPELPTGIVRKSGPVTFTEMTNDLNKWYTVKVRKKDKPQYKFGNFTDVNPDECVTVDLAELYNSNVSDIFNNEYISPRPSVTTLEIPTQGIGDWCHPKMTADIDDKGLRDIVHSSGGIWKTDSGVPFKMASEGNNIAYTSLWNNYPDSVSIPLSGNASHIYLAMAGSTNHMQWGLPNGILTVEYRDGRTVDYPLENPVSWAPIEQDFYNDNYAFAQPDGLPYPLRFCLADGRQSKSLGDLLEIKGVEPRRIPGGAGILLDLPVYPNKQLKRLKLKTLSNDVVIGIMSLTLQTKK